MSIHRSLAARPSSLFLIALAAGGCAEGTITSSPAPEPAVIELSLPAGERPTPADEPDPSPALLEPDNAAVMRQLATTLSRERTWLTPAVVEALARRAVDLDEVFADAPPLVSVDDSRYVVQLEALGPWADFDAVAGPFAVALSAEIAEPAGDDSLVASVAGQDRMLAEADLEQLPVIFVTLATPGSDSDASPAPALALGVAARTLRFASELPRDAAVRSAMAAQRRAACTPIEPSCDLGDLTCPTGTDPFLVMTEILVNDKHEPWLRGAPEIEAFVVRVDEAPTTGGAPGVASTTAIFDGAVHSDARGRTRVLPDVNQIRTWYPISGGFALFPYALGDAWAVTGVEDDTEKGVWHARGQTINWIALFETVLGAVSAYEELQYLELLQDLLTIFDMIRDAVDTDDMLQPAIGVDRGLFEDEICDGAASWNTVFSLGDDSGDLAVRAHFACLPSSDLCP